MLRIGERKIKSLYLGEQPLAKLYVGDTLVFQNKKPSRLPEGYTEVEYISNPDLTYMSLYAYLLYTVEASWELTFELTDTSKTFYILGGIKFDSSTKYSYNYLEFSRSTNSIVFTNQSRFGSSSGGNSVSFNPPDGKATFTYDYSANTATLNGVSRVPVKTGSSASRCNLFGANGSTTYTDFKVYGVKIYTQGGALEADLVPAIRGSDGMVGLFNLVDGSKFLTSEIKGKNFAAGPAV